MRNMAYYGEADLTRSSAQSINEADKVDLAAKKKKLTMKLSSSPILTQNEAELNSLNQQVFASYARFKPFCVKKEFESPSSNDHKYSLMGSLNQAVEL